MTRQLLRTDKFNDQLHDILHYIADDSGSVDVALKVLDRLEHAIGLLRTSPHMGVKPRYGILRKQGYRALIVDKYLIFYKADDARQQIMLYAIVNAKQEYVNLI
jgi:toxin ParE1/3/4